MVVEGYQAEAVGECSITADVAQGPFVRSPYMVTQQMVGKPFYIGAPTVKAFGSAIGLVEESRYDEILDQKDQEIEDLKLANAAQEEELKMLRPAAQRYFIEQGQVDGTTWEQQAAEDKARIKQLEKALQQANKNNGGGRPKKEAAIA